MLMLQDNKISKKSRNGIEKILSEYQRVTVPVELIQYCWHEKSLPQLKIYLTLKLHTTGRILLDKTRIKSVMNLCAIRSERTLKKHLNWLIENHWLCLDQEHNIAYIKSFCHIHDILNLKSPKSVLFRPLAINNFRLWCASILIAKKVNEIHWGIRKRDKSSGKRSAKASFTRNEFYAGLSDSKVAELLNVSEKEAWKIKRQAHELGFLKVKRRYKFISKYPLDILKFEERPDKGRFKIFKKRVWERSYDEIQHNINFGRKISVKKSGILVGADK